MFPLCVFYKIFNGLHPHVNHKKIIFVHMVRVATYKEWYSRHFFPIQNVNKVLKIMLHTHIKISNFFNLLNLHTDLYIHDYRIFLPFHFQTTKSVLSPSYKSYSILKLIPPQTYSLIHMFFFLILTLKRIQTSMFKNLEISLNVIFNS